jgi:hypothetical protein
MLFEAPPVIIIGAPRSGTNILRDVLTRHPACDTWPCDEINYIWRHGNRSAPTDELGPEAATLGVRRFIRKAFADQGRRQSAPVIVEKTCANSLRVPFVETVVPEARYVFLARDGWDVVASAMKRWQAHFDPGYVARKARFVPISDVPYYALRFLKDRWFRRFSHERRASSWGPRFTGMDEILDRGGLAAVCAAQWSACVIRALDGFQHISTDRVHEIRYETFVTDPIRVMEKLAQFLQLAPVDWADITRDVRTSSLNSGGGQLTDEVRKWAGTYLKAGLNRLGGRQSMS